MSRKRWKFVKSCWEKIILVLLLLSVMASSIGAPQSQGIDKRTNSSRVRLQKRRHDND